MWLIVYSNDYTPLTVRPIYSSSKLRTAQMMIFSLVAMIGLEKCCITSAYLQWLCHSGERVVAHGPLVFFFLWRNKKIFTWIPLSRAIWAAPYKNVSLGICGQWLSRYASAQSDQGLCCLQTESLDTLENISMESKFRMRLPMCRMIWICTFCCCWKAFFHLTWLI